MSEPPYVATPRMQADGEEARIEPGRAAGDNQVAAEQHVHSGSDCGAVDGGNRGEGGVGDPQEAPVDAGKVVAAACLAPAGTHQVVEYGPGTKRPAGADEHDRPDTLVGLELVEGRVERHVHLVGDGVAAVGVVEGEDRNAAPSFGQEQAHSTSLPRLGRHLHPGR